MRAFLIALAKAMILPITMAIVIVVYSHGTVVVTDDEWEVCVATGRCEFGVDRFVTPEEMERDPSNEGR